MQKAITFLVYLVFAVVAASVAALVFYPEKAAQILTNPSSLFQDPIVGCWEVDASGLDILTTLWQVECFAPDESYTTHIGDQTSTGYWERLSDREVRVVVTSSLGTTAGTYVTRVEEGSVRYTQKVGQDFVLVTTRVNDTGIQDFVLRTRR